MRRGTGSLMAAACGLALACGCTYDSAHLPPPPVTTLTLERTDAGIEYCDAMGVCQTLPYTGDCTRIQVEVNTATAGTCQRCVLEDGTVRDDGCSGTAVACVLVTLSDPDCVVCAWVDGAVVYSTCATQEPRQCTEYTRFDDVECQTCYDPAGRLTLDTCGPDCRGVACPPLACAPGFAPVRLAGECCPQCLPPPLCEQVVCTQDFDIPSCPPGMVLRRDPVDCCSYLCAPTECPAGALAPASGADCTSANCEVDPCPPGYSWSTAFPHCGQCVPATGGAYCTSSLDCMPAEHCAFDEGACSPNGDGAADCYGVCRPAAPNCTESATATPVAECDGAWVVSYDAAGCPVPACLCPDGSLSIDGTCRDLCAEISCIAVPPPQCDAGFHVEHAYPYCCGVCVPDDICSWYDAGGNMDPTASVYACPEVLCAPGFHSEPGPDCCPACAPDDPLACAGNADCRLGEHCTTEEGDCQPAPRCDPAAGEDCAGVCYGSCVLDTPPACQSAADCARGHYCSTTDGACDPAPDCDPTGLPCDGSCWGACVPELVRTCAGAADCLRGELCTTTLGACEPPPECEPNTPCAIDACWGTCLPEAGCIDSDGINPAVAGEVVALGADGQVVTAADRCATSGAAVIEAYCYATADGQHMREMTLSCSRGCVAGACSM